MTIFEIYLLGAFCCLVLAIVWTVHEGKRNGPSALLTCALFGLLWPVFVAAAVLSMIMYPTEGKT